MAGSTRNCAEAAGDLREANFAVTIDRICRRHIAVCRSSVVIEARSVRSRTRPKSLSPVHASSQAHSHSDRPMSSLLSVPSSFLGLPEAWSRPMLQIRRRAGDKPQVAYP
jgi:hypothetical protein